MFCFACSFCTEFWKDRNKVVLLKYIFNIISFPPTFMLTHCETTSTILFFVEKALGNNSGNCFLCHTFSKCCAFLHTN